MSTPRTHEEIRRAFGFGSCNSVQKHLKIPWGNRKRALTLVEPGPTTTILPLLGRVAAGRQRPHGSQRPAR